MVTSGAGVVMALEESPIKFLPSHFVEERMAHEARIAAPLGEPAGLERQAAQHVVDEASHLFDPPTGPGPDLRRCIVEHRDAVRLGTARDPPIEAGEVDEHDGVGSMMAKVAVGPPAPAPGTCAGSTASAGTTSRPARSSRCATAAGRWPSWGRRSPRLRDRGNARATAESGWPRGDRHWARRLKRKPSRCCSLECLVRRRPTQADLPC